MRSVNVSVVDNRGRGTVVYTALSECHSRLGMQLNLMVTPAAACVCRINDVCKQNAYLWLLLSGLTSSNTRVCHVAPRGAVPCDDKAGMPRHAPMCQVRRCQIIRPYAMLCHVMLELLVAPTVLDQCKQAAAVLPAYWKLLQ